MSPISELMVEIVKISIFFSMFFILPIIKDIWSKFNKTSSANNVMGVKAAFFCLLCFYFFE